MLKPHYFFFLFKVQTKSVVETFKMFGYTGIFHIHQAFFENKQKNLNQFKSFQWICDKLS